MSTVIVERRDGVQFSLQEFLQNYVATQTPVLVYNAPLLDLLADKISFQTLLSELGSADVHACYKGNRITYRLCDYLASFEELKSRGGEVPYVRWASGTKTSRNTQHWLTTAC